MKYKVGDMVLIKDIDWYHENKNKDGHIYLPFDPKPSYRCQNNYVIFWPSMALECGTVMTIDFITDGIYIMKGSRYGWTDDMIERLATESEKESLVADKFLSQETKKTNKEMKRIKIGWTTEFECPDGYEFHDENGNVINTQKIVLEKKKKEYPKTYEECCKVLGYDDREVFCIFHTGADESLFEALYCLKVCRDAYWKIAGEEMGLGKPWKPNWGKGGGLKFRIFPVLNFIVKHDNLLLEEYDNRILTFPTAEMRDAFYENFKDLIEECKELI